MKNPLTYDQIVHTIEEQIAGHMTMLYASALLYNHLTELEFQPCLEKNSFFLAVEKLDSKDGLLFTPEDLYGLINTYSDARGIGFETACQRLQFINSHTARSRALNVVFEILKKYFGSTPHWEDFHMLDWFQVLYILRNSVSHLDGYNNPVKFLEASKNSKIQYPQIVQWKTIRIEKGQLGQTIRFNDREILDLLNTALKFFLDNRSNLERN